MLRYHLSVHMAAIRIAFVADVNSERQQREENNVIRVKEDNGNGDDIIVIIVIPVAPESTAVVAGLLLSLAQILHPDRANWRSMTVAVHLQID